jgi:hypothetical protein
MLLHRAQEVLVLVDLDEMFRATKSIPYPQRLARQRRRIMEPENVRLGRL